MIQHGDSQSRRLSDVSRAQPGDVTLQNLLGVLVTKLDSCRRLPLFAFEAANEGHTTCARAFRDLADAERAALDGLLDHLADHLAERRSPAERNPAVSHLRDLDPEESTMNGINEDRS